MLYVYNLFYIYGTGLILLLLNHKIYSPYTGKKYINLILVVTCFPR